MSSDKLTQFNKMLMSNSSILPMPDDRRYVMDIKKPYSLLSKLEERFKPFISIVVFSILIIGGISVISLLFSKMKILPKILVFLFCMSIISILGFVFIKLYFMPTVKNSLTRHEQLITLKSGVITMGILSDCQCDKFITNKRLKGGGNFYRVNGTLKYINLQGEIDYLHLSNIKLTHPVELTDGMKIPICLDAKHAIALYDCSMATRNDNDQYYEICKENKLLFAARLITNPYDNELQEKYYKNEFYKARTVKSIVHTEKLYSIAYGLGFASFFSAFCGVMAIANSVIKHNPNDKTQITLAIMMIIFFGGVTFSVSLLCAYKIISSIFHRKKLANLTKTCLVTYGNIIAVDEYTYTISNKNSTRYMNRIIANYRFINANGVLIDGTFYCTCDQALSPSLNVGDSIPVLFNSTYNTLIESFESDLDETADIDGNKTLV